MGITSLTPLEAVLVALSGLVIVFLMLGILCLMIPVVSRLTTAVAGRRTPAAPAAPTPAPAPAPVPEKADPGAAYTGQVALIGCDEKTAAMVMAVVSYETGIPLDSLIFHRIRAL